LIKDCGQRIYNAANGSYWNAVSRQCQRFYSVVNASVMQTMHLGRLACVQCAVCSVQGKGWSQRPAGARCQEEHTAPGQASAHRQQTCRRAWGQTVGMSSASSSANSCNPEAMAARIRLQTCRIGTRGLQRSKYKRQQFEVLASLDLQATRYLL